MRFVGFSLHSPAAVVLQCSARAATVQYRCIVTCPEPTRTPRFFHLRVTSRSTMCRTNNHEPSCLTLSGRSNCIAILPPSSMAERRQFVPIPNSVVYESASQGMGINSKENSSANLSRVVNTQQNARHGNKRQYEPASRTPHEVPGRPHHSLHQKFHTEDLRRVRGVVMAFSWQGTSSHRPLPSPGQRASQGDCGAQCTTGAHRSTRPHDESRLNCIGSAVLFGNVAKCASERFRKAKQTHTQLWEFACFMELQTTAQERHATCERMKQLGTERRLD
jgi:hypothetical protein